jgi:hypothetical protein
VLKHRGAAGNGIGEIEGLQPITAIAAGSDQLHPRRQLLAQGLAQLAGGAGEQDFHANTSPGVFRDATDAGRDQLSRQCL